MLNGLKTDLASALSSAQDIYSALPLEDRVGVWKQKSFARIVSSLDLQSLGAVTNKAKRAKVTRRAMSAEAKAKISAAQKKRWASRKVK